MIYNINNPKFLKKNVIIEIAKYEFIFILCTIDIESSLITFYCKSGKLDLDYIFFKNYLKNIINSKMDIPIDLNEYLNIVKDDLNYMRITNNLMSKKALANKLGCLLIHSEFRTHKNSYLEFDTLEINDKTDELVKYLYVLIYNLKSFCKKEKSLNIKYDDDYEFNILDYVFDYNID